MRTSFRLDIYTILIVALVPTFLAIAWGLTWNYERILANRECDYTGHYLTEVGDMASLYTDAGTLQNADTWLTRLQAINPSTPTRDLHQAVVNSMSYAMNTNPDLDTTEPGAVYDTLVPFRQTIDKGAQEVIDTCPEFERLLSYAFPMYFREETP